MNLLNPLNPENVLQVLSPGNRAMLENLTAALSRWEAEAEALELAGDEAGADEAWGRAAEVEDTLEGVVAEFIEESGTDSGWRTSEDEPEADFGMSVYESLFRIGHEIMRGEMEIPGAMLSHYSIKSVDEWPLAVTTRFLARSDRADLVWAAGQQWRRTPLDDGDDPRRPADSTLDCVNFRGERCGPVHGVWTGEDGRMVGPQTLIDLRVKPVETQKEVAMRRVGDVVRNCLRQAFNAEERWTKEQVAALSNDDAYMMAVGAYYYALNHHRSARHWNNTSDEKALQRVQAWIATQRRAA